jgi:hypothetical protein
VRQLIKVIGTLLLTALAAQSALPQSRARNATKQESKSTKPETTVITSVQVVVERGVPAVEILSTRPAVPSIQFLDSPPRLVIDLLHAEIGLKEKKIDIQQGNILCLRAEQFQKDPPIARIVLDLLAPYSYTWDEAGNRLMVRLKPAEEVSARTKKSTSQAPRALSLSSVTPSIVPITGGGEVRLTGSQIAAGSSLTTGPDTAVLQLSRGGEVRLCPRSTVSVTPSKNGKDMMLGMSNGALETHYALGSAADTVMTPDFRILFAGPGEFDFAVSTDSHGNTCVRGLAGNSSSAMVSELMGDRVYQVKPNEQAVFRAGQIDKIDNNVPPECGCPPPVPVESASVAAPNSDLPPNTKIAEYPSQSKPAAKPESGGQSAGGTQVLSKGPETVALPPSQPNDIHVQMDAPLVFRGKKLADTPPAPVDEAAALPVLEQSPAQSKLEIQIQPPNSASSSGSQGSNPEGIAQQGSAPRRFFRRLKGIFGAIFK